MTDKRREAIIEMFMGWNWAAGESSKNISRAEALYEAGANHNPAIKDILEERRGQDRVWGQQNHSPEIWLSILMEEVGELSQEMLNRRFDNSATPNLQVEMMQVAAVAVAMLECCMRNKWSEELKND